MKTNKTTKQCITCGNVRDKGDDKLPYCTVLKMNMTRIDCDCKWRVPNKPEEAGT